MIADTTQRACLLHKQVFRCGPHPGAFAGSGHISEVDTDHRLIEAQHARPEKETFHRSANGRQVSIEAGSTAFLTKENDKGVNVGANIAMAKLQLTARASLVRLCLLG